MIMEPTRRGLNKVQTARPPHERILARIDTTNPDACWIWPGATRDKGRYGCILTGSRRDGTRKVRSTHIVMWEAFNGPVPEGLELDHLCRESLCCNPRHMEPVTHQVNTQRGAVHHQESLRARAAHARSLLPWNADPERFYQGTTDQ